LLYSFFLMYFASGSSSFSLSSFKPFFFPLQLPSLSPPLVRMSFVPFFCISFAWKNRK
jgi:hypothetical protein